MLISYPPTAEACGVCLDLNVCLNYYSTGSELCLCYTVVPVLRITDFQPGDLLNYVFVCIAMRTKSFFLRPFVWKPSLARAFKHSIVVSVLDGSDSPIPLCSEYEFLSSWSLNSGLFFSLKHRPHLPQDVFLTPSSLSSLFPCWHSPQLPTFAPGYWCPLNSLQTSADLVVCRGKNHTLLFHLLSPVPRTRSTTQCHSTREQMKTSVFSKSFVIW